MNGQQLTNSSNSANGTPSSSYPASLSSQSSRDPSPATQLRKPLMESYNHVNHWSTPAPGPPPASTLQPSSDGPGLPQPARPASSEPRPVAPSSQALYKFPPPTSLPQPSPNHLPSLPAQAPGDPPRSTHSPQTQPPFQTQSTNQIVQPPNHFQKSSNPFQPGQFQNTPKSHSSPIPYQFSQSSVSQAKFSQPNQNMQPPIQTQPQHMFTNQFGKPPSQIQPQNQFSQPPSNQMSPPLNQIPQSNPVTSSNQTSSFQPPTVISRPPQSSSLPNQISTAPIPNLSHHPSQKPPLPNQISQTPSQMPPIPNHSQPPIQNPSFPNQRPPVSSQMPYANQGIQPPSQVPPIPRQMPPTQLPSPPNQMGQSYNQLSKPQGQMPTHPNQFSQPSYQVPHPPSQSSAPNHMYPASNQVPQAQYLNTHPGGYMASQQQANNQFNKRYPQMTGFQPSQSPMDGMTSQMAGMSVQQGFNQMWGMEAVDLLKCRDLLPREKIEPPPVRLHHELYEAANCSPELFRCTLTKIPETKSLLDKSRLPLGVLIHPFKDLNQLSVIQCTVIVRCRMCRTYINPFVYFVDNKRWKCNLCFRVNELPDEFQFDPMTKTYGDPSRRPEIKSATIEFIAPSEYMVRPPQPAIYVFVLDVSRLACDCGYLSVVCRTLLAELDALPGDARTSVAFITFDSAVHFYGLTEGQAQPHQMIVMDIDDMFLPTPDDLLVNLHECRELIRDLLTELPNKYQESYDTHSALGAALQAAYKLLAPTGGRVTVFQACLPNTGPGALSPREDPAQRAGDNPPHLNPSTDFYKKLALDCSGQQVAVDLFLVNSQYVDLATLSGVSRFSGGCMHHIPLFRADKPLLVDTLQRTFTRYLTRKIGFESVMRLRCTRGLSIHTFHGNFFVRSTDLLSLPNANPDAGFGMQVTIEESLTEVQNVCFQAALLYTSSKGERRIRVHTLCLPVVSTLADLMHGADQQCIVGLLTKMAADRATQSSLSDAREAFVNVVADVLSAYRLTQSSAPTGCLIAPSSLKLLPLYVLAALKHMAFRVGQSTRLDDRLFAMCQMKSLPLTFLLQYLYPDLYPLLDIENQPELDAGTGEGPVPQPPRLQLSAERIHSQGLFLLDDGCVLLLYVGHNLDPAVCQAVFNVSAFSAIPHDLFSLPELENPVSKAVRTFVTYLQNEKPYPIPLQVLRDDSPHRMRFIERLIEDKNEAGNSYYEFLQRVKSLIKN